MPNGSRAELSVAGVAFAFAATIDDLRYFQRVSQTGDVVITNRRDEHLALVLKSSERVRVDDPVTVTLERRADGAWIFRCCTALGVRRTDGKRRERLLPGLQPFSYPVRIHGFRSLQLK